MLVKKSEITEAVELVKYIKYILHTEMDGDKEVVNKEIFLSSAVKQYCNSKKTTDNVERNIFLDKIYESVCENTRHKVEEIEDKHSVYNLCINRFNTDVAQLIELYNCGLYAEATIALTNLELTIAGLTEDDIKIA